MKRNGVVTGERHPVPSVDQYMTTSVIPSTDRLPSIVKRVAKLIDLMSISLPKIVTLTLEVTRIYTKLWYEERVTPLSPVPVTGVGQAIYPVVSNQAVVPI